MDAKMTAEQRQALAAYVAAVRARYGANLVDILVFGSRARGDERDDSDVDLAILLLGTDWDGWTERSELIDLGYETFIELGLRIQPWPVRMADWQNPEHHTNPRLIRNMQRDGKNLRDVA